MTSNSMNSLYSCASMDNSIYFKLHVVSPSTGASGCTVTFNAADDLKRAIENAKEDGAVSVKATKYFPIQNDMCANLYDAEIVYISNPWEPTYDSLKLF